MEDDKRDNQNQNQNKTPDEENQTTDECDPVNQDKKKTQKEKSKKRKTYFDGIMTLIGSQLHSIGFGSLYALFNLHTYLISYLRYHQKGKKTLTLQYIYFISLVMSIVRGFFTPFVSFFENKLGLIKAIILGALIDTAGTGVIYLSKNYYVDLLGFFIISIGQSLTALRRRNVMSYFFHVRGKLSGIISIINSFVTSGYNVVCEKWIVNPKSENPTVDKDYYSIDVSKNILKYIQFIWCCTGFCTLVSLLMIVPFDEAKHGKGLFAPKNKEEINKEDKKEIKKDDGDNNDNNINNIKNEPLLPDLNDNDEEGKPTEKENEEKRKEKEKENEEDEEKIDEKKKEKEENKVDKKEEEEKKDIKKTFSAPDVTPLSKEEEILKIEDNNNYKEKRNPTSNYIKHKKLNDNDNPEKVPKKTIHNRFDIKVIKKALKSKRILRLFLMGIFSAPLGNFFMNTWRNIGIRKKIDTSYLQNIGTYSPFTMFSSSFIFGFLSDYVPFRYLVSILSFCCSLNGILFCFSLNNPIFFTIVVLANTFFGMGIFAVYEPHYIKVFGIKHYIELGGVVSLPGVIMGPICTVFIFIFENIFADNINNENGSDLPYFILFIVSSLLNLVSSFLSFFESEEEITSE